jgi:exopolysaccharide production protein ExoQ
MESKNNSIRSNIFTIFPTLFVLIYFSGIDRLYYFNQIVDIEHNPLRQMILGISYILAGVVVLRNLNIYIPLIRKTIINYVIIFFIFISGLWVLFPLKVAINFFHAVGMSLVILSSVNYVKEKEEKFLKLITIIIIFNVIMSFIVSKYFPEIGTGYSGNWGEERLRWTGLYLYPNSLGLLCITSIWIIFLGYYLLQSFWMKLVGVFGLIFTCLTLYKSNSVTSIICSVFIMISFLILMPAKAKGFRKKFFFFYILLFIFSSLFVISYAYKPEMFTKKYFFEAVGRDSTLTGRHKIWEEGLKKFHMKPILGWGYDFLKTLNYKKSKYNISQYHNGYLTAIIEGGIVAFLLFIILLLRIVYITIKIFNCGKREISISFFIFILTVLIRNITESTLFRYVNLMWFVLLLFWFYFEYIVLTQKDQNTIS